MSTMHWSLTKDMPLYNIFETITITDICTLIKLFSQHLSIYKLLTDSLFNTVAPVLKHSRQVFYSHYIHQSQVVFEMTDQGCPLD